MRLGNSLEIFSFLLFVLFGLSLFKFFSFLPLISPALPYTHTHVYHNIPLSHLGQKVDPLGAISRRQSLVLEVIKAHVGLHEGVGVGPVDLM